METQVAQSITPFRSPFPFEVMVSIIALLDSSSQAVFSLTSRAYNDEVNRLLWRSITIDPSALTSEDRHQVTYLHNYCDALLRVPRRAGHIRSLTIYLHPFPVESISAALAHISRALTVLTGLVYLNCGDIGFLDQDSTSLLFSAGRFPFCLKTLVFADIDPNMPSLRRFLASQPEITWLKLADRRGIPCIPDFPISTLPNLQHIDADCSVIDALAPHRPISSAKLGPDSLFTTCPILSVLSRPPVQILELDLYSRPDDSLDEIARRFPNLRYLRPCMFYTPTKRINFPAFPELQVLWCESHPHESFAPEEVAVWASNCPSLHTVLFGGNYPGFSMRYVLFKHPGGPWDSYITGSSFYYNIGREHYVFPKLLVDHEDDSTKWD